jgi:hypothetical protein
MPVNPSEPIEAPDVATAVQQSVRATVLKQFAEASEFEFTRMEEQDGTWAVEGRYTVPASSWPGSMVADYEKPFRFEGTVNVGPGSSPGRTSFNVSLRMIDEEAAALGGVPMGGSGGSPMGRTPNDQRSDVFNPTSAEHRASANNRSNQMNPNNSAHARSRGKK